MYIDHSDLIRKQFTSGNLYKLAVQVATGTEELYKLQLLQNLNLYITYIPNKRGLTKLVVHEEIW